MERDGTERGKLLHFPSKGELRGNRREEKQDAEADRTDEADSMERQTAESGLAADATKIFSFPDRQAINRRSEATTPEEENAEYVEDGEYEEDEEDEDGEPPAPRKWLRNTIVFLFVAALLGNVVAFWPRIYNMETLPFLFKSRELSVSERIQGYKQAVVSVGTDKGSGTGFHLSNGYILTNHHVVEDAAGAIVQFPDQVKAYDAKIAASDANLDLALLKIELGDLDQPRIELEWDRSWQSGEHIYIVGNPLFFSGIAAEGKVLGSVPIGGREKPVLALDAPVFKGNSGSPVINGNGKAIGIVYATAEVPSGSETVEAGLAVPIGDAAALLEAFGLKPVKVD